MKNIEAMNCISSTVLLCCSTSVWFEHFYTFQSGSNCFCCQTSWSKNCILGLHRCLTVCKLILFACFWPKSYQGGSLGKSHQNGDYIKSCNAKKWSIKTSKLNCLCANYVKSYHFLFLLTNTEDNLWHFDLLQRADGFYIYSREAYRRTEELLHNYAFHQRTRSNNRCQKVHQLILHENLCKSKSNLTSLTATMPLKIATELIFAK